MNESPAWLAPVGKEAMLMSSSVGVKDSCFVSMGLSISEVGVRSEGTGRVGSSEGRVGSRDEG